MLSLEQRVLRFLVREEDDERRALRELLAQPVEVRVLEGDCIQGARFRGGDGGALVFEVADNPSKFRAGDTLAVGDGHDLEDTVPLVYGGYDARAGLLRLERDPYAREVELPLAAGQVYVLDKRPLGLQGRLRDVVRAAFAEPKLRTLLDGQQPLRRDAGRYQRALLRLADAGLNPAQIEAGAAAIATESLALVQGPPGTGKTRLLAQVTAALCASGCRIALCAFTHRAVDNALLAIRRAAPGLSLVKVGTAGGDNRDELRQAGVQLLDPRRARVPERHALVAGTCFQLAKLGDKERFHYTVFDEAGQLPIPHALAGMLRAQRWLLFGDHLQLPPVISADHADREVCTSIFEHLHRHYGSALLDTTYRMNDGVCRVVSDTFYGGQVRSAELAAGRRLPFRPGGRLDLVLDPRQPVVWLRIDHRQPGQRSTEEANAVADVVEDLLRQHGIPAREVAVIAPFRAQVRLIRHTLQQRNLPDEHQLVVDTVERIQGQEREAIVLSLTVGDPEGLAGRQQFFLSTNRLNVALSRARTKAVIVGSGHLLDHLPKSVASLLALARLRRLLDASPVVAGTALYCGGAGQDQPMAPSSR